jgi:phosphoenolpyruvate-protein phosphotransferase (PTS system enzyme I)
MSDSRASKTGASQTQMHGIGIGARAVAGPVLRMGVASTEPPDQPRDNDAESEVARAADALAEVAAELRRRAQQAREPDVRDILDAQAMMADDPALASEVSAAIRSGKTAARAIFEAYGRYRDTLAAAGPYLAARVADLDDLRQRAVAACLGVPPPGVPSPGYPFVLVASDLAPADTATLDGSVLALVTERGGPTSHTAVLARARDLPAVVGCGDAALLVDGDTVLVDPARSLVVRDPDAARLATFETSRADGDDAGPGRTADGHAIALLANIGGPDDVAAAVTAHAEGVGLYRTELLFLDAEAAPGHGAQVQAYKQVFGGFGAGQRVVIRVLDAGADKPMAFLSPDAEPNPALGVRGLRALRAHPDVLEVQLAAIAEAARETAADVWVMAPMVAEPAEAAWFRERCDAHGLPGAGVMVEVPSAAMLAGEILAEAAFVSIGTNDLAQYALAVDRQASGLAELQDPWHPGLLRLVALVGAAGQKTGKPVGVCGEAAADPMLARVLAGLGVTSLSMAPAAIAGVRRSLAGATLDECRALAERVLAAGSAAQARQAALT